MGSGGMSRRACRLGLGGMFETKQTDSERIGYSRRATGKTCRKAHINVLAPRASTVVPKYLPR